MAVTEKKYGVMPDGTEITEFTIDNGGLVKLSFLNYGGIVTRILVDGTDVVLGRASLEEYLHNDGYIGAAIGRYANRIRNGRFQINDRYFNVSKNEGENSLHGGDKGFDQKVWTVKEKGNNCVVLRLISPDGDEGFPGELSLSMRYTLTKDDAFRIEYEAVCTEDTVCTFTNHTYFNLNGHDSGKVYDQMLRIDADYYLPNYEDGIPMGEVWAVSGTVFDFRSFKKIGKDIHKDCLQLTQFGGYDHNFAINGRGYRRAATACSETTNISMEVFTDQPGLQLYTANALPSGVRKGDKEYGIHDAFCLETQAFPNSPCTGHFPSPVLKKGEKYYSRTEYRFSHK